MRKIPTIFDRDWDGDRSRVTRLPHKDCDWVFRGEGVATIKIDGSCCMMRGGKLFKRRELKGGTVPEGFELVGYDEETKKTVGWMPVGDGPEDQYHRDAFVPGMADGTYELVGPKVQGGVESFPSHQLVAHGIFTPVVEPPRDFDGLSSWLSGQDIEGLVFHHPDGRMAKIKLRDFGLKRPAPNPPERQSRDVTREGNRGMSEQRLSDEELQLLAEHNSVGMFRDRNVASMAEELIALRVESKNLAYLAQRQGVMDGNMITSLRGALLISKRYVENEIDILCEDHDVADAKSDLAVINASLSSTSPPPPPSERSGDGKGETT